MDFDDLNYLIETPCYRLWASYDEAKADPYNKKLFRNTQVSPFKAHPSSHDECYQRYTLDYDQTQKEELPLLVSFVDPEPRTQWPKRLRLVPEPASR